MTRLSLSHVLAEGLHSTFPMAPGPGARTSNILGSRRRSTNVSGWPRFTKQRNSLKQWAQPCFQLPDHQRQSHRPPHRSTWHERQRWPPFPSSPLRSIAKSSLALTPRSRWLAACGMLLICKRSVACFCNGIHSVPRQSVKSGCRWPVTADVDGEVWCRRTHDTSLRYIGTATTLNFWQGTLSISSAKFASHDKSGPFLQEHLNQVSEAWRIRRGSIPRYVFSHQIWRMWGEGNIFSRLCLHVRGPLQHISSFATFGRWKRVEAAFAELLGNCGPHRLKDAVGTTYGCKQFESRSQGSQNTTSSLYPSGTIWHARSTVKVRHRAKQVQSEVVKQDIGREAALFTQVHCAAALGHVSQAPRACLELACPSHPRHSPPSIECQAQLSIVGINDNMGRHKCGSEGCTWRQLGGARALSVAPSCRQSERERHLLPDTLQGTGYELQRGGARKKLAAKGF